MNSWRLRRHATLLTTRKWSWLRTFIRKNREKKTLFLFTNSTWMIYNLRRSSKSILRRNKFSGSKTTSFLWNLKMCLVATQTKRLRPPRRFKYTTRKIILPCTGRPVIARSSKLKSRTTPSITWHRTLTGKLFYANFTKWKTTSKYKIWWKSPYIRKPEELQWQANSQWKS